MSFIYHQLRTNLDWMFVSLTLPGGRRTVEEDISSNNFDMAAADRTIPIPILIPKLQELAFKGNVPFVSFCGI
jgi:hypothetical protein